MNTPEPVRFKTVKYAFRVKGLVPPSGNFRRVDSEALVE
jgi:hypothetical protein